MAKRALILFVILLSPLIASADQDCSKAAKLLYSANVLGSRGSSGVDTGSSSDIVSEAYVLCPNSPEVAYAYATSLADKGDYEAAMKVYSSTTDQSLDIPKAILLAQMGKVDQASSLLEKVLGEQPRKVEALQALSNLEFKRQNYNESERLVRLAIQEKAEDASLFYNLGITLEKLNRLDESRLALLTSTRLDSSNALTSCALARVYMRQVNIVSAKESAEKAISLAPQNYITWFTKGLVSQQQGSHQDALESFKKAENIDPNDFKLKLAEAVSEINLGRKPGLEKLKGLRNKYPEELDISKALLWALVYLKDYKAAYAEVEQIIAKLDNDSIALNNLGVLHKHLGKEDEAEKFFKRSIELNPALKQAQKNLQLLIN